MVDETALQAALGNATGLGTQDEAGHPLAVVVDEAAVGERERPRQIGEGPGAAPPDVVLGNVVAAPAHPLGHAADVQVRAGKGHKDQTDLVAAVAPGASS